MFSHDQNECVCVCTYFFSSHSNFYTSDDLMTLQLLFVTLWANVGNLGIKAHFGFVYMCVWKWFYRVFIYRQVIIKSHVIRRVLIRCDCFFSFRTASVPLGIRSSLSNHKWDQKHFSERYFLILYLYCIVCYFTSFIWLCIYFLSVRKWVSALPAVVS